MTTTCPICEQTSYKHSWLINEDNVVIIQADVFTNEIATAIFDFALENELFELTIDWSQAEFATCEGCSLLTFRHREKILDTYHNNPEYKDLVLYD